MSRMTRSPEMAVSAAPAVVREARIADYAQIAAVLTRNGLGARAQTDWESLWCGNPALADRAGSWPIGWVLETPDGRIVGAIGNIPMRYEFGGRRLCAAVACDWAVDPPYRAHSLALLHRLSSQKQADLLICTTVSPQSEPAFKPLGWSKVPAGAWNSVAFWITNFLGFSRVALRTKRVPFAQALSYPVAAALYGRALLPNASLAGDPSPDFEVEPRAEFDQRFDAFWEELKAHHGEALIGVRTRETLEWHFRGLLRERRGRLLCCTRNGRLVAYGVTDRCDNPETGLKRVRCIDLQVLPGREAAALSIFQWTLRKSRQDGVAVVENLGCWLRFAAPEAMRVAYRRAQPSWCFYYKPLNRSLAERLKAVESWRVSAFDGDICL